MKINQISPDENIFTQRLINIAKPPKSLCYMGQLPSTPTPVVAIVGSRKPTRYGIEVTRKLSFDLAKRGVVIVSGLALGVDAVAHKSALEANGLTVAVLVNALPDISPKTNLSLAREIIAKKGALISEYGPDSPVSIGKWSFLERNRLVSGLADAIIVTEAASRSGTLNTVSHALAQGREVFAVPGNITSPLSEGCNDLIKQGATPITDANDALEIVAPQLLNHDNKTLAESYSGTPSEMTVLTLLSQGIRDGDQLIERSGLSASDFATTLTMLEINGLIRPLGANQWTIR